MNRIQLITDLPAHLLIQQLFSYLTVLEVWALIRAYPPLLIHKLGIENMRQLQFRLLRQIF